ncbi:2-oxo acid dehydrogenase subunit E2 [Enterococcus sp. BWB1-3]|uniref:dihydrolipoamide acetyltransferase family protein n=1 Tax=Enterococcus sp. BWB1-3 TaxID=2787713 RepID=UPI001924A4C9|nr:dihydrolipoamide acetyltransferase family protein [Enterococcus sp. BWB1-3]MBL1229361.1 2-oxo acid dehydrogenase subunit E2 [Enterococcus sp. BWB1-3]
MAYEVLMPKLSSTMTDGTITVWLKNEGDTVEVGEAIFEVMTDKIAIEVEAYEEGILLKRYIGDGESAPVNSVIAYIGEAGESVPEEMPRVSGGERSAEEEEPSAETPKIDSEAMKSETSQPTEGKIRATPAARRAAREKGVDLKNVIGSGPKGRIQAADISAYTKLSCETSAKVVGGQPVSSTETSRLIPWCGMRKVIAENMHQSTSTIPHVTMSAEVNMSAMVKLREQLLPMIEEQIDQRLSYLELIIKATTIALKAYPMFNAHGTEEGIRQFDDVNMGVAVALPEGLIVPVVKQVNRMGLSELTASVKDLTGKARASRLAPDELIGGTFTISSLGRSRVKEFTPIINAPEAAILGVGGLFEKLSIDMYNDMEKIEHVPTLNLCLSFDHRVADGAPAAAFLSMIAEILENPMRLLL